MENDHLDVVGRILGPEDFHLLKPRIDDYVKLPDKRGIKAA